VAGEGPLGYRDRWIVFGRLRTLFFCLSDPPCRGRHRSNSRANSDRYLDSDHRRRNIAGHRFRPLGIDASQMRPTSLLSLWVETSVPCR